MFKKNLPTIIGGTLVAFCGILEQSFPQYGAIFAAVATLASAITTKVAHDMEPPATAGAKL